ncbi:SLBB domain-containing protein [Geothrix oryzisoli]|uniref:SLBB domain-containing protein n=1 Tax=Geothrix oryzisoli TaxID=2922721 RepID=UPI001FAB4C9C|nr:SLBB domain-containing protein [Geothrix oryzisoli]
MRSRMFLGLVCVCTAVFAQLPQGLDLQALKQAAAAAGVQGMSSQGEVTPSKSAASLPVTQANPEEAARERSEDEKLEADIKALKAREKGPRRFASDLFLVRQRGTAATEGGIAEDYVLGTGDRLNLNVFGSATFDLPVQVDGRGEIVIPKVGTAKVGGLTLGKAKAVVQGLVGRSFSRSTVDLQVIQLREVRIFVLGEVYKPGSYLVSSLSSLVNVLGLAGGPTAVGSYRDIRVMRGGKKVFSLDLYPLRAEGLGNPNVALQSGDTIFVPLAQNQVLLEGAFQRVVGAAASQEQDEGQGPFQAMDAQEELRARLLREKKAVETQLGLVRAEGRKAEDKRETEGKTDVAPAPSLAEQAGLEDRLQAIQFQLEDLRSAPVSDHRLRLNPANGQPLKAKDAATPDWLRRWTEYGTAPQMQFEMREGETAQDALRWAGGFASEAGAGTLTLRRRELDGMMTGRDIPLGQASGLALQRGDVLSSLPRRERRGPVVEVAGWVRVPGVFARTENLRVGDFLKRENQVLPDSYLGRGEVVHTGLDGTQRLQAFDVAKALAGDPAHNLLLEDRDRIELFRLDELRLPRTVSVVGPVARPGTYGFLAGMRASDLIFRAGILQKDADGLIAELARSQDGKPSEVIRLDLVKLLSTEASSPVALLDDTVNPLIRPDDQLSLFARPDFKIHRTVRVSGQVARPGSYALDQDRPKLSDLVKRAGGLTAEAMPKAGIFIRRLSRDVSRQKAAAATGVTQDPTAQGINDILDRLNETKRQPLTGQLLRNPIMHGLVAGDLNRLVVDFDQALKGNETYDVELQDGDEILIPRRVDAAYVVGETASPFASFKVVPGEKVSDLLRLAGGTTRNADTSNIRLLKADGRILDSWVEGKLVEPGDTVLVPQRFRRDTSWQENLQALTPLALILNAIK